MNILLVLIPLSLLLVGAALYAFFWAVDNDQFEDMETPALDILVDDLPAPVAPPAALDVGGTGESAGRDAD